MWQWGALSPQERAPPEKKYMEPIHKTERSAEDTARYNNTDLYDGK
jgi:hypothetical protein